MREALERAHVPVGGVYYVLGRKSAVGMNRAARQRSIASRQHCIRRGSASDAAKPTVTVGLIEIFTDGACRGNPGPGGWAALLRQGANEKMLSGAERETTNNRMEMMAAIEALRSIDRTSPIRVTTDSEYLRQGVTSWVKRWKANGWRTAAKKPVKNQDLWVALDELAGTHRIEWCWVKGHSGHVENERVDAAANDAIDELLEQLRSGTQR